MLATDLGRRDKATDTTSAFAQNHKMKREGAGEYCQRWMAYSDSVTLQEVTSLVPNSEKMCIGI